ncbi:unnamed protein product [Porites evermanni]|uniref:Uncharacterized protein n=1 Tax=Porites evermanni TaxID=104178 RepID=A0ABN8S080_9CNID|nr:unnamed protein product [Porites evermanni]
MAVETKKHEDGLEQDGKAGEVSSDTYHEQVCVFKILCIRDAGPREGVPVKTKEATVQARTKRIKTDAMDASARMKAHVSPNVSGSANVSLRQCFAVHC